MKRAQDEWYFQSEPLGQRERPITTKELANHFESDDANAGELASATGIAGESVSR
jgi:hypothetical protein